MGVFYLQKKRTPIYGINKDNNKVSPSQGIVF